MIQLLAEKYNRHIAYILLLIFMSGLVPAYGRSGKIYRITNARDYRAVNKKPAAAPLLPLHVFGPHNKAARSFPKSRLAPAVASSTRNVSPDNGGPSQPEMSSFQPAGAGNLVNLFTGDFSYNIPLLDVGGYPVNIFYDGSVSMEQDASWVGLGWNLNPGNINRNMRGVPDDFNGNDTLETIQTMKPNKTWGVTQSADLEILGIKNMPDWLNLSLGASLGISVNNYLGPALEFGIKGGVNFNVAQKVNAEKTAASSLKVNAGVGADLNSRHGLTLSPNVSLTAAHFSQDRSFSIGLGLATSYNSRTGIKGLQINEQFKFNSNQERKRLLSRILSRQFGSWLASSSISFARPSYIPALRMPITNSAWSGHFQLGLGLWGVSGTAEVEVYGQVAEVAGSDTIQRKPMVGYLYYENARNNPAAVMDFTRLNDKEVNETTPIISAPQYTYDVFSIQGEGTGGSIRAYRNDHGYVRDKYTASRDKNLSLGVDLGLPGHIGANFNTIKTPTTIGEWQDNNLLRTGLSFRKSDTTFESVYFRNPGEISVLHDRQFNKVGGTDLVRFQLGGTSTSPSVLPVLERFSATNQFKGIVNMADSTDPLERKKRTQVISMLTASEATVAGLDTAIKSYDREDILDTAGNLAFTGIPRVSGYRKPHHISQINVTETDGRRYVYGIPVYNIRQKDFTFSVNADTADLVGFNENETNTSSPHLASDNSNKVDGFLQVTQTPAYAHSFLLTGLLSPDYVDVTGNGITEDDLGTAVNFNYSKMEAVHKWRTPLKDGFLANNNRGNLTQPKDDKGLVSYGERESWYLHSLESKTMIAFFILGDRADGKGAADSLKDVNYSDASIKRLTRIDLYNKADLKKNGLGDARPIKSVHFQYSYRLCADAPGNNNSYSETIDGYAVNSRKGKLTLDKIYFTFNGQTRASKNQYVFDYGSEAPGPENPAHLFNASDRWGNYKPRWMNPDNMKNADYPYSIQPKTSVDSLLVKQQAGAWALKKILLPSGGQLEVEYESDDYAYVQNRRAAAMMQIAGFGNEDVQVNNKLYGVHWPTVPGSGLSSLKDNDRVYIKVPIACHSKQEVYEKYLSGTSPGSLNQLAFKLAVNMPKGVEYVSVYATVADYNVINDSIIWVKLNPIDGISPLVLTAIEYLREQLPGQAYPGYDVSESAGLAQIGDMLAGWLDGIKGAFKDPLQHLRSKGLAQSVVLEHSFVRLNDPDGIKYGGGHRVKQVVMKDNWNAMTGQFTATYGQRYDYTTTEVFHGQTRTISSGVASYEPSIGGEENPFYSIVQVANKLPIGPTSYGAIEMPVLDAFFPAPVVGYSKVTVHSLNKGAPEKKSRSGVGKQVTEFYTAKDFPVYYNHTAIDPAANKQAHTNSLNLFFYKYAFDSRALSQGFVVATNDMHGKMKSQSSYAENDSATRINYTEHFYRNTGSKGLNEKFDFVYNSLGGEVRPGNIGIDIELMTDTREFSVKSSSLEIQGQLDLFPVFLPWWIPTIWPVFGKSESTYRAVTTTKVISYHGILDSVVVIDKGSQVSTRNLVFDAETGEVIVSRTNNEFDTAVYNTSYPAYWAYSGMGLAYKNIDAVYANINFYDGKIVSTNIDQSVFESGDELLVTGQGAGSAGCIEPAGTITRLWALDKNKDTTVFPAPAQDLIFIDEQGKLYTKSGVSFRIIRSGKRNMLGASVAAATTMTHPVNATTHKLDINSDSKVINASVMEFKEQWQTDNDIVRKVSLVFNPANCTYEEVTDCNGYLEKSINPYRKGLIGNFRSHRSLVFYGSRMDSVTSTLTNLPGNGFLSNFKLYWDFDVNNNLVPDVSNSKWVWNQEATRFNAKGMELESKNALNIYSAAQYGYHKSLPVAITNNARFQEMFYEGFEDIDYQEETNDGNFFNPCIKGHVNFSELSDTELINTDSLEFKAHSGKNVLKVLSSNTIQTFKVEPVIDNFQFQFPSDTTQALYNSGGNIDALFTIPQSNELHATTEINNSYDVGNTHMNLFLHPNDSTSYNGSGYTYEHAIQATTSSYINVPENGNYTIYVSVEPYIEDPDTPPSYLNYYINGNIIDLNGNNVSNTSFHASVTNTAQSIDSDEISFFLCKGIYKLKIQYGSSMVAGVNMDKTCTYTFDMSPTLNVYKDISVQDGCISTLPIPATDSMLNPTFSLPAGKKMLFSAWVKEPCGDIANGIPCNKSSYTGNAVQLQFDDAGTATDVTLAPSGPIIDGWQRIEGAFDVPANAGNMTLNFINTTGSAIYYDDIRIHPFNANMKSFVYDPVNLRLVAELDANNYATFYEYDAEGGLIRTKAETTEGIKTIQETRSYKQRPVTTIQP